MENVPAILKESFCFWPWCLFFSMFLLLWCGCSSICAKNGACSPITVDLGSKHATKHRFLFLILWHNAIHLVLDVVISLFHNLDLVPFEGVDGAQKLGQEIHHDISDVFFFLCLTIGLYCLSTLALYCLWYLAILLLCRHAQTQFPINGLKQDVWGGSEEIICKADHVVSRLFVDVAADILTEATVGSQHRVRKIANGFVELVFQRLVQSIGTVFVSSLPYKSVNIFQDVYELIEQVQAEGVCSVLTLLMLFVITMLSHSTWVLIGKCGIC